MSVESPALLVAPAPGLRLPWRDRYPSMAMAGGTQPEHLAAALGSVAGWVETRL
jgi:hypothetical protein